MQNFVFVRVDGERRTFIVRADDKATAEFRVSVGSVKDVREKEGVEFVSYEEFSEVTDITPDWNFGLFVNQSMVDDFDDEAEAVETAINRYKCHGGLMEVRNNANKPIFVIGTPINPDA